MTKSLKLTQLFLEAASLAIILWATVLISYAPSHAEAHFQEEPASNLSTAAHASIKSLEAKIVLNKLTGPQTTAKKLCVPTDVSSRETPVLDPLVTTFPKVVPNAYWTATFVPMLSSQVFPAPFTQILTATPFILPTQSSQTKILNEAPSLMAPTTLPIQSLAKNFHTALINDKADSGSTIAAAEDISVTSPATTPAEDKVTTSAPVDYNKVKVLESVPWDAPIQKQILEDVCGGDIEKFIMLMSVAQNESHFDTTAVGDNGKSFGPFQIKADCHAARMAKYGVSIEDLHDPVKSAYVALDYLEEIKAKRGVSTMAHEVYVVYNAGHYTTNSKVSARADRVMDNYNQFMAEYNEAISS